jgi:hypothetical protein
VILKHGTIEKGPTRDEFGRVIMEGLNQEQIRKEAQELYRAERNKTVLRPFIIMPGALCGAVDVGVGDLLQASFDGLGTVSVRFA